MNYYEKNGHTAFKSDSGTEYYLPESAAFENVPHFKLTHRQGTNDCRCFYECDEPNPKGERLVVELGFCENFGEKNSLARIWFKNGRKDHVMESWWSFNTEVRDEHGCFGRYNPTELALEVKLDKGRVGRRYVTDFDWILDANEQNALLLFEEAYRRFMAMEPIHMAPSDYYELAS